MAVPAAVAAAVPAAAADSNCRWWLRTEAVDDDYGSGCRQSLWVEAGLAARGWWAGGNRAQTVSGLYCAIDGVFRLLLPSCYYLQLCSGCQLAKMADGNVATGI